MNNKIKIYTMSGRAENGKNFIANLISNHYESSYNKKVCQLANGDYLKFLSKLAGWDGKKDEQGRKFLQEFGTEYVRDTFDEDFWVNEIIKQIKVLSKYYNVFVITDTRYPNEIEKLYDEFGAENIVTCHISRIDEYGRPHKSILTEEQLNHPSETALNGYDFDQYILNSPNIDEVSEYVFEIVDVYERYWSEVNNEQN